jgi:hypothetical protein
MDEFYELEISKRFLMCPYFEKRIKGMKEFKMIQQKLVKREGKVTNMPMINGRPQLLTMKTFSEWILANKVIEFIFKENAHQELIKRSQSILYILAQDTETLPESTVNLIWQCCQTDKHEDIVRVTYELVTDLAAILPRPRLLNLNQLIQKIPISQIDEKTVLFIKDFTLNTLMNLRQNPVRVSTSSSSGARRQEGTGRKRGAMVVESSPAEVAQSPTPTSDPDEGYFDLDVLWNIARDSNKVTPNKTKELALSSLIEVISAGSQWRANIREPFINKALSNI